MRTVTTSKGQTFPVDYCIVGALGVLKMQVHDERRMSAVAAELDECENITYTNRTMQETFTGYTELRYAWYVDHGLYVIELGKKGVKNGEL